jgi:endonuclease III
MAARILHEEVKSFSRWSEINVAVDVHIKRVWKRAGIARDLTVAGIMRAAVELKPDYPGELDYPTWIIGMEWCHQRGADCQGEKRDDGDPCPLLRDCPKIGTRT